MTQTTISTVVSVPLECENQCELNHRCNRFVTNTLPQTGEVLCILLLGECTARVNCYPAEGYELHDTCDSRLLNMQGIGNARRGLRKGYTEIENLYCMPTEFTGLHTDVSLRDCQSLCDRAEDCTRFMIGEGNCILHGGTDCSALEYSMCYNREGWTVYESCEGAIDFTPQTYITVENVGCSIYQYQQLDTVTLEQCQSICDHAPACTRFVWETYPSLGYPDACTLSYTPECDLPDPDVCFEVSGYTLYESCPNRL